MRDDLGEPVELDSPPKRVVSLVPSLTEAVAATVPGVLVGATDYCTHPGDLDVARIGGSKYPKVDEVRALRPDLVVANEEENQRADVDELRAAGIPVWVTHAAAAVPDALGSLRRMFAEAFDQRPGWLLDAERTWSGTLLPVRAVAVIPVWRKPWVVLGRDTFAGDVLRRLGIANLYLDHDERYPRPSQDELREAFAAEDAELLVLPDEPYAFSSTDGPDAFGDVPHALISGRHLTWYGPSLTEAKRVLTDQLA